MAAENRMTLISPNVEEYRTVKDDRRFTVFSKGLLESLEDLYSADFAVVMHRGVSDVGMAPGVNVICSSGSIPVDFENQASNLFNLEASHFSGGFRSGSFLNDHCLFHRLQVTEQDSLLFILGYQSATLQTDDSRSEFASSLDRIQVEIADLFLVSQQAQKIEALRCQLEQAEEVLESVNMSLNEELPTPAPVDKTSLVFGMETASPKMSTVLDQVSRIGLSDLSLLIRGEVGTGKAYLARKIHEHGNDPASPFEMISCGALTPSLVEGELFGWKKGAFSGADEDRPGLFERAHGGTVFLDEVSELPLEIQQKLLRVIQENEVRPIGSSDPVPVKCRLISSSCKDLLELVEQGTFREDLYYRLAGFQFEVPALRERGEDLDRMIQGFLKDLRKEHGFAKKFSESALMELKGFTWPGNIQQLKNVVQQAYLISEKRIIARKVLLSVIQEATADTLLGEKFEVTPEEICIRIPRTEGFNEIISEVERAVILAAMRQNRGNKSRVTKQLRIPRQTLYNKLERFDFTDEDLRA